MVRLAARAGGLASSRLSADNRGAGRREGKIFQTARLLRKKTTTGRNLDPDRLFGHVITTPRLFGGDCHTRNSVGPAAARAAARAAAAGPAAIAGAARLTAAIIAAAAMEQTLEPAAETVAAAVTVAARFAGRRTATRRTATRFAAARRTAARRRASRGAAAGAGASRSTASRGRAGRGTTGLTTSVTASVTAAIAIVMEKALEPAEQVAAALTARLTTIATRPAITTGPTIPATTPVGRCRCRCWCLIPSSRRHGFDFPGGGGHANGLHGFQSHGRDRRRLDSLGGVGGPEQCRGYEQDRWIHSYPSLGIVPRSKAETVPAAKHPTGDPPAFALRGSSPVSKAPQL